MPIRLAKDAVLRAAERLRRGCHSLGLTVDRPVLLLLTLGVGAAFRLWHLGGNPAGFFCDEAWVGNTAASLLATGKDTLGFRWPILFHAFAGWRTPAVVYPVVPSIALLGVTELAVRLPSALYGLATIYFMVLLGRELRSPRAGWVAGILLAVSPWHVHVTRIAFDAHVCVFFATATLYFLFRARRYPSAWPFAGLFLLGFLFSYTASFVQAVLLAVAAILVFHGELRRWWSATAFRRTLLFVGAPTVLLVAYAALAGMLLVRYRQAAPSSRTAMEVVSAMLRHFSAEFLAVAGESGLREAHVSRHSIKGLGLLLPFQYALFVVGTLVAAFHSRFRPEYRLTLIFLALAPLPAALVGDLPAAIRSVVLVVPVTVLSAVGVDAVLGRLPRWPSLVATAGGGAAVVYGAVLLGGALRDYPKVSSDWEGWQYGYREALEWAAGHHTEFETVWVSHRFNAGEELMAFYRRGLDCPNCRVMRNPIEVNANQKEFFFARSEDLEEAGRRYPMLRFREARRVVSPDGRPALYGGVFESTDDRRSVASDRSTGSRRN